MKLNLKRARNVVFGPNKAEFEKDMEELKKMLGKEKYDEIVVRAFVESILKESPIIKEMERRIRELEALGLGTERTP